MKRYFQFLILGVLLLGLVSATYAQEVISPEDAGKFIGQHKTVCGKVDSTKYAKSSKGQPTFLNLNKPYPKQIFTIVIFGPERGKFQKPPEVMYEGKDVCVSGVITEHKGKTEIVVKSPSHTK